MMKQKELRTKQSSAELAKFQVEMRKQRGKFTEENQKLMQVCLFHIYAGFMSYRKNLYLYAHYLVL